MGSDPGAGAQGRKREYCMMAIIIRLDVMLALRKMRSKGLAAEIR